MIVFIRLTILNEKQWRYFCRVKMSSVAEWADFSALCSGAEVFEAVHVMTLLPHPLKTSPVLGEVTVITGTGIPMENEASLISVLQVFTLSVIRTRQFV